MENDRRTEFKQVMPVMLSHQGVWEGIYTHLNDRTEIIDQHSARVTCEFPDDGPFVYIQHNHFTWSDGRELKATLPGVYKDHRLWWDTDTFHGSAWQTKDDLILLNLERKDEPGAHFIEIIAMGDTGEHRSRTWHWFKDGRLYKRTLCDEKRI